MILRFTVSALVALAVTLPATAAEISPDQKFNVMGSASCANWPKIGRLTSAAKAVPLNWVLGFVSGRALETNPALLPLINPDEIDPWLTAYCAEHPMNALPAAALQLAKELEAKLPPPPPPPVVEPPMFRPALAPDPAPAAKPKPAVKRKAPVRKAR